MKERFVTSRSAELADRLRQSMPGGDTRTGMFYEPYPIALERGESFLVWDVDGNEYLDFVNNQTSLIHGHAHPAIVSAISMQASRGTAFPAPHEGQAELAERIRARIGSIEHLRFCNSGSEAVLMAVRGARAFTGRDEIVKVEGAYHGCWEQVHMTRVAVSEPGVPARVRDLVHIVDIGDVDGLREAMSTHGDAVAAILIDPVGPGYGGPPEFFREAREVASKHGALLILDEVISFRLDFGGYQNVLGLTPDLTTLGKIIGGGLPVGAFGGRADVMEVFDPRRPDVIMHSGTFNGNPLTTAAGCVSLDLLVDSEVTRINALGKRLGAGLEELLDQAGIDGRVRQLGSLISFSCVDPQVGLSLHRAALEEGVYFSHRGLFVISTPMDDAVVDQGLERLARAMGRIPSHVG